MVYDSDTNSLIFSAGAERPKAGDPNAFDYPHTWVLNLGWSVLDGKARFVTPSGVVTEDADGHTIVNAKFGARFLLGNQRDLYVGYGRSLTGQRWYNDIIRADVRFRF